MARIKIKDKRDFSIGPYWAILIIFWAHVTSFATAVTLIDLIPKLEGTIFGVGSGLILGIILYLFLFLCASAPIIVLALLDKVK